MVRRIVTKYGPDPIDVHVGLRIKYKRVLLGLSQTDLGLQLGLTFQQIQKYETGANRVSASKLYRIAEILACAPSFVFDDLPDTIPTTVGINSDPAASRAMLEIAKSMKGLSENDCKVILSTVRNLSKAFKAAGTPG